MRTPEGYEKADIKKYLDTMRPRLWYFMPFMAGRGAAGIPDIAGCYEGRYFAIEVKPPGRRPNSNQWRRMREIDEAGGKSFWGDAAKVIPEFKAWINGGG